MVEVLNCQLLYFVNQSIGAKSKHFTFPWRGEQQISICAAALCPKTPFFLMRQCPSFFQKSACLSPQVITPPSASKQQPSTFHARRSTELFTLVVQRRLISRKSH